MNQHHDIDGAPAHSRGWLARAGAIGFTFFLVKGLLWLAAPAVLVLAR